MNLKRSLLIVLSLIGLVSASAFIASAMPASVAYAQTPQDEVCRGIGAATGNDSCGGGVSLTSVVENIINIFSVIIGIVAVIMIIYGGFRFVTAGGDSGNISAAKNTIIYAIIGLVIVALAQAIVRFVISNVTGGSSN